MAVDRVGRRRDQASRAQTDGKNRILIRGLVVLTVFACGILLTLAHLESTGSQAGAVDGAPFGRSAAAFPRASSGQNHSAPFCLPWPSCALPVREPEYRGLCDLLGAWSPDDPRLGSYTSLSPVGKQGRDALPVFDFGDASEVKVARAYRKAELPFLLRGVPDLDRAKGLWGDAYLRARFAEMEEGNRPKYKIERSTRKGHFLYFKGPGGGKTRSLRGGVAWSPPQESVEGMTYGQFEAIATTADADANAAAGGLTPPGVADLLYLTISAGLGGALEWVVESLPFFRDNTDFFRVNYPESFHGINCRFGMRGVVQAAHYDHGRNFIAMVKGHKRYVILPPRACGSLELLDRSHPSARHASFDWANQSELDKRTNTPFCMETQATEVVLAEGEVLYLPSFWFHYIVSLDRTVQCNSRAGNSDAGEAEITSCMHASTTSSGNGF